jgi:hypothetical protein
MYLWRLRLQTLHLNWLRTEISSQRHLRLEIPAMALFLDYKGRFQNALATTKIQVYHDWMGIG